MDNFEKMQFKYNEDVNNHNKSIKVIKHKINLLKHSISKEEYIAMYENLDSQIYAILQKISNEFMFSDFDFSNYINWIRNGRY